MISSFHPPQRTLMGPGPSDVNPRILSALGRPTIGHLDPEFIKLMDEIKTLLQATFQTKNALTLPISAPGSAGMECCFVNLVEPQDKVIVCQNGVFGGRMKENVVRAGGEAIMVQDDWGQPIDPEKLKSAITAHPDAKIVAMVHAETSTGVVSDIDTLCNLASKAGMLSIVDTVTGLAGIDVNVDRWQADAVYSGTQKCLSCIPGLSPVTFSDKAVKKIQSRQSPVNSWFLDLNLILGYWGEGAKRAYHHTAPINPLYALHEALLIVQEEGLENAWARHKQNHLMLKDGLEKMGLQLAVEEPYRLPQLNAVSIPEGINDAEVRSTLLNDFNLEIGAGLGDFAGKVWRIGLMGYASNPVNVRKCLSALDCALKAQN